jgi:hypothetical protein
MIRNAWCLTTGSGWALATVGRIVHRGITISGESVGGGDTDDACMW